jgi:murein L,D-transpeptidase YafK
MRRTLLLPLGALLLAVGADASADTPDFPPADFVLVEKGARRLTLYADGQPIRVYGGLQMGDAPVGPKHFEGDERTPEGRYTIDYGNPDSAYFLSLHVSYPDSRDRDYAARLGRSPGGAIFIHGQPNGMMQGRVPGDWTDGCIALSNAEIEELWGLVGDGTPIEIRP